VTILQVVRNPGWLTPYLGCIVVSLGLIIQFVQHLVGLCGDRQGHEESVVERTIPWLFVALFAAPSWSSS